MTMNFAYSYTNYNELFMRFKLYASDYELNGLSSPLSQMISSHRRENFLEKSCRGVIAKI